MRTNLKSNLLPIINVGMYNSQLDSENILNDYLDGETESFKNYFWNKFDNNKYVKFIEDLAKEFLNGKHTFNSIELNFKVGSIYSPKYYNFATDNIDFEVTFNKSKVLNFAKKNKEQFNEYLNQNYSSYDGFISFTSNNFNDWLNDFKVNNEQSIGAILSFIVLTDEYGMYYEQDFYNFVYTSEFNTNDFVDMYEWNYEIKTLETFIKDNYINLDSAEMPKFEFIDDLTIQQTIKDTINSIESHTLEFQF